MVVYCLSHYILTCLWYNCIVLGCGLWERYYELHRTVHQKTWIIVVKVCWPLSPPLRTHGPSPHPLRTQTARSLPTLPATLLLINHGWLWSCNSTWTVCIILAFSWFWILDKSFCKNKYLNLTGSFCLSEKQFFLAGTLPLTLISPDHLLLLSSIFYWVWHSWAFW